MLDDDLQPGQLGRGVQGLDPPQVDLGAARWTASCASSAHSEYERAIRVSSSPWRATMLVTRSRGSPRSAAGRRSNIRVATGRRPPPRRDADLSAMCSPLSTGLRPAGRTNLRKLREGSPRGDRGPARSLRATATSAAPASRPAWRPPRRAAAANGAGRRDVSWPPRAVAPTTGARRRRPARSGPRLGPSRCSHPRVPNSAKSSRASSLSARQVAVKRVIPSSRARACEPHEQLSPPRPAPATGPPPPPPPRRHPPRRPTARSGPRRSARPCRRRAPPAPRGRGGRPR